ncbi:MAG: hypothetical protein ACYS1A_06615 [Planctomycetota bacterium]|jgi:ribosomal protein L37AE/L43A
MGVLPNYKDIIELVKKGSTVEAQEQIMCFREEIVSLRNDNLQLRQKNSDLKSKLDLRSKVKWEDPYYWLESEGKRDGPFCQRCYDKDTALIRLQEVKTTKGLWECFECKKFYKTDSYKPPPLLTNLGQY